MHFKFDGNLNPVEIGVKEIKRRKGNACPPIMAVTAHCTEEEKELLTEVGITDIATKPFTLPMLVDVLNDYVYETSS